MKVINVLKTISDPIVRKQAMHNLLMQNNTCTKFNRYITADLECEVLPTGELYLAKAINSFNWTITEESIDYWMNITKKYL
jgi:hypothetical protein